MLRRRTATADQSPPGVPSRRDGGATFVEILVAIVLLGTGVLAVLAATRATTIASATERDHVKALEWLQSATEILLNDAPYESCSAYPVASAATDIQAVYQAALRADAAIVPLDWASGQISVAEPVQFGQQDGSYTSACVTQIERQLVVLEVTDPDGDIVETLQVVVVPS